MSTTFDVRDEVFDENSCDPEADHAEFHTRDDWKKLTAAQRDAILSKYASRVVARIQRLGRIVRLSNELIVKTRSGKHRPIDKTEGGILATALYRTTKTVITN